MAQKMLDSLSMDRINRSEYWRMKYLLLKIRIDDKNYRPVTSDVQVREVVDYFELHGDCFECQEAFYYAGSVYRDLRDHPLSLHYFLEAMAVCEGGEPFDTTLLRNTYSNLSYQYFMVQDYENAAKMSEKEYRLSAETGNLDALSAMQLAVSLSRIDRVAEAEEKFVEAYELLDVTDSVYRRSVSSSLLYHFSSHKMREYAEKCFELACREWDFSVLEAIDYPGLAEYYLLSGRSDSAIYYHKLLCERDMPLLHKHESNKSLLRIYYDLGNMKEAARYGIEFAQCSDSLDLGERQRLAATVNNAFQYQREKIEEEALVRKEESHRRIMSLSVCLALGGGVLFVILFLYQRNRNLSRQNAILKKLKVAEEKAEEMERHIQEYAERLKDRQTELEEAKAELIEIQKAIDEKQRIVTELREKFRQSEAERQANEQLLAKKARRNRMMSRLINRYDLAERARHAAEKMYEVLKEGRLPDSEEWSDFYSRMDALYPCLKEDLLERSDSMKPEKLKVGYLIRAGFQSAQIGALIDSSRTTVWRWIKELEWVREEES
ncbi:MAG: hypothetical protein K2N13_02395 [Paraprevotella sp.]|nr:hypothetical protein [Paraprevotella sp.]